MKPKKYPDTLAIECATCHAVYTYHRESVQAMLYCLSPAEEPCSWDDCFRPTILHQPISAPIVPVKIFPRLIMLVRAHEEER